MFALFWVAKLLTTGIGETGADFLGTVNLVLAAVVGLGGFAPRCGPSCARTATTRSATG